MHTGDNKEINKADSVIMGQFFKSSFLMKVLKYTFFTPTKSGNHRCPNTTWRVVLTPKSKDGNSFFLSPGISQMCSWCCRALVWSHILLWGFRKPQVSHTFRMFNEASASSVRPAGSLLSIITIIIKLLWLGPADRPHSMSGLIRLSSSSETVRFPMYQKIQKIRLRKISRGPDSTKKSQKLKGAKIPRRRRTRPTTSKITATDRKKTVTLLCSMARWDGQVDVVWRSDRIWSESFLLPHNTPYISFIAQDFVGKSCNQPQRRVELLISIGWKPHSPSSFLCRADLFCTFHVIIMTHPPCWH